MFNVGDRVYDRKVAKFATINEVRPITRDGFPTCYLYSHEHIEPGMFLVSGEYLEVPGCLTINDAEEVEVE